MTPATQPWRKRLYAKVPGSVLARRRRHPCMNIVLLLACFTILTFMARRDALDKLGAGIAPILSTMNDAASSSSLSHYKHTNDNDAPVSEKQEVLSTATATATLTSTFPLILGDPSLVPVDTLEKDLEFQEHLCGSYRNDGSFSCTIEWDEWMLSRAFVRSGDVVMEFGARFATTSCILASAVGPTGAVVSVEPDDTVHGYLLYNRYAHNCGFHAVLGTVGPDTQYRAKPKSGGYASQTVKSNTRRRGRPIALPNIPLPEVERLINRKINVALIDCEGCIDSVDGSGLLDQVDLILMEEDMLPSYGIWHTKLVDKGFRCLWYIRDTFDSNIKWSQDLRHSAWLRNGVNRTYPTCTDYVQTTKVDPKRLICDQCPKTVATANTQ